MTKNASRRPTTTLEFLSGKQQKDWHQKFKVEQLYLNCRFFFLTLENLSILGLFLRQLYCNWGGKSLILKLAKDWIRTVDLHIQYYNGRDHSANCCALFCVTLISFIFLIFIFKKFRIFKIGNHWPLFDYFCSFQTIYRIKTVDLSGIRTQIIRVEGKHADHLNTTTVLKFRIFPNICLQILFNPFLNAFCIPPTRCWCQLGKTLFPLQQNTSIFKTKIFPQNSRRKANAVSLEILKQFCAEEKVDKRKKQCLEGRRAVSQNSSHTT